MPAFFIFVRRSNMEKYNDFIKGLELIDIALTDMNLKRNIEPEEGKWRFDLTPNFYNKS